MPFSEGSCHVESSPLAYVVNRLTCFYMVWVFTYSFFQTDFLIVLISFSYLYCHWVFAMFFGDICWSIYELGDIKLLFLLLLLLSSLLLLLFLFYYYYYC